MGFSDFEGLYEALKKYKKIYDLDLRKTKKHLKRVLRQAGALKFKKKFFINGCKQYLAKQFCDRKNTYAS